MATNKVYFQQAGTARYTKINGNPDVYKDPHTGIASNPCQPHTTNPIFGFLSTSCLESYAPYWHKALRNIHCLAS